MERATANLLLSRRQRYREVYGAEIRLVAVCGSRSGLADADGLEPERLDKLEPGLSGPEFIEASGADILIEVGSSDFRTGGPSLGYIRSSLSAGHDAIVISKGALIHSGPELRALARSSGAMLKLSGAAASELPAIDLPEHSLKGCEVLEIEGILNATTNYLLDAMMNQNLVPRITHLLRDLGDGEVRGLEKLAGSLHPQSCQIDPRRHANALLEHAREMKRRQSRFRCQFVEA